MFRLPIIIVLALLAASAFAEPTVVRNGPIPARGARTLQLEEMWRAGGPDDEENFFGLLTWAEEGPDGLLYVLDVQLCQANVYDREGHLVRTLFGEGDGPGEVRRPRDLVILPDGSIGAVQEFPGKLVRVDENNNPLPGITPRLGDAADGGFVALSGAESRGGSFMISGLQISPGPRDGTQERHMYLALVDAEGAIGPILVEQSVVWDFSNFIYEEALNLPSFFWASAVGPDGHIYTAPDRDSYRIEVYAPDGTLERVIEREFVSRKRTAEDKAWVTNLMDGNFSPLPFSYELKICDTDSDIYWMNRSLQVDEGGFLWVLSSRGARDQDPGVLATYDVFAPDGTFDRQVRVACEGDATEDGAFLIGEDRVLVIKGFVDATSTMFGGTPAEEDGGEADPMEIVCYRITGEV